MEEGEQESLIAEIRNLSVVINKLYKRQSPWIAFTSGMMHSLGYFVGFVLITAIIVYLLQRIPLIPMIGEWLGKVLNEAMKNVKPQSVFPFLN